MAATIVELLQQGADDAAAVLEADGATLTHAQLRAQVAQLAGQLESAGIGSGDRVAIVLPNGPEMAITFLAVASCATAAPLNPGYREEEFRFYLDDLGARTLVTLPGEAADARAGLPDGAQVLELSGAAGALALTLDGEPIASGEPSYASPDDVALVLHTSGTTARPKIVPLLQRNLAASAGNIATSLALGPTDRCLNVMPLFHIHGLIAAVLATLGSGGSVACTPGFDGFRFFQQLQALRPTWYTAVPTMHQLILQRNERSADVIAASKLRFIRSSSAALPPSVMQRLEEVFGAPVIEAYGMTEASHQMAANPLPPAERKPGSVGIGTGLEITVLDEAGSELPQGETGEVSIAGPSVTSGYEANPEANASAFSGRWFRTGDQGYLDRDGYLYLTGRLKEVINRGGEKVSPREVDEVLLAHPAVEQAVAFAIAHDKLGEDVAAAVILAEGSSASEAELRRYAAEHLADFKVPRKIMLVDEIPKGPTGKLQRIGLAAQLGLE